MPTVKFPSGGEGGGEGARLALNLICVAASLHLRAIGIRERGAGGAKGGRGRQAGGFNGLGLLSVRLLIFHFSVVFSFFFRSGFLDFLSLCFLHTSTSAT